MRKLLAGWILACVNLLGWSPVLAVNVEMVMVGNIGNAPDTTGYGGVDHVYQIGRYEVTAGQYTEFLNKVATDDVYNLYNQQMWDSEYGCKIQRIGAPGNYTYSIAADRADRPVNFVSCGDMMRFVNWLSNGQPIGEQNISTTEDGSYFLDGHYSCGIERKSDATWAVPTEDEWYKAAYHKNDGATENYWLYPTSSNTAPGRDLLDISGNNANYHNNLEPYPIDGEKYTTVVGEFQNSLSPYGVYDQGGNIMETTLDPYMLRGGGFHYNDPVALSSQYRYFWEGDEVHTVGFRVAYLPGPAGVPAVSEWGLAVLTLCGLIAGTLLAKKF